MNHEEQRLRDTLHHKLNEIQPRTSVEEIRRQARRGRTVTALATVLLLLVAGIGGYALTRTGEGDQHRVVGPGPEGDEGRIAFTRFGEDGGIMTMNADGSDPRVIAPTDYAPLDDPAWSPDGTKIAFHGFYGEARNQAGGLFVMNADGSDRRLVTLGGGMPTWSPDGERIAFNKDQTLQIVSLNGTEQNPFVDVEGEFPDWSPDGELIAFIRYDLYAVASAGGVPYRLLDNEESFALHPSWSPDGTQIAFTAPGTDSEDNQIRITESDGTGLRTLTDGSSPTWSPDGTRIAFTRPDGRNRSHIYSIGVDGRNERQLTFGDVADHSPDWAPPAATDQPTPTETQVGYVVGSDEIVMAFGSEGDIWLALSDGSVVNITHSSETESSPTISFDDKVLVYEREGRLVYNRLDTGESAEFADGYSPAFGPLDYLAWDSGAGEVVIGSPFSDWTVRAPNGPRGQGATSFSFAWDQSLELLHYSVAVGHGVSPHYIDVVRVDGWECAECGGGLELGRVRALQPDDGTEGEFLSTSFGTSVDVLRVCCREGDTDAWETVEIGGLDPFDTGTVYNRIRGLDDVPLDLSGTNLELAHAGSLEATVRGDTVEWRVTNRNAWFVINGFDLWLVTDGRDPVRLPFKVTGEVAVAPTFAGSPLIHSF